MCYSGRCMFEDHMGDCRYADTSSEVKRLLAVLNVSECFAGGLPEGPEFAMRYQQAVTDVVTRLRYPDANAQPLDVDTAVVRLLGP